MGKSSKKGGSNVKSRAGGGSRSAGQSSNQIIPIVIIVAAVLALIIYMGMQQSITGQSNTATQPVQNQLTTPPMTGTEEFTVGQIDPSKAKTTTFRLDELAGTDCTQQIIGELKKIGGTGRVIADYSNTLLEVEHDPAKITDANMVDALIKANHPGKVTPEKIQK